MQVSQGLNKKKIAILSDLSIHVTAQATKLDGAWAIERVRGIISVRSLLHFKVSFFIFFPTGEIATQTIHYNWHSEEGNYQVLEKH